MAAPERLWWKPGQSGNPKGRPAGALAKRTQEFREKAKKEGCDPIDVMLDAIKELLAESRKPALIGKRERLTLLERASTIAKDAAPYLHPKLATVELSGEIDIAAEFFHRHAHLHTTLTSIGLDMGAYSPEQLRAIEDFTRLIGAAAKRPDGSGSVAGGSTRVEPEGEG